LTNQNPTRLELIESFTQTSPFIKNKLKTELFPFLIIFSSKINVLAFLKLVITSDQDNILLYFAGAAFDSFGSEYKKSDMLSKEEGPVTRSAKSWNSNGFLFTYDVDQGRNISIFFKNN
jgi:hypothetical protein